jgi:hypothetical protein
VDDGEIITIAFDEDAAAPAAMIGLTALLIDAAEPAHLFRNGGDANFPTRQGIGGLNSTLALPLASVRTAAFRCDVGEVTANQASPHRARGDLDKLRLFGIDRITEADGVVARKPLPRPMDGPPE